jgi:hypothetical protein
VASGGRTRYLRLEALQQLFGALNEQEEYAAGDKSPAAGSEGR